MELMSGRMVEVALKGGIASTVYLLLKRKQR